MQQQQHGQMTAKGVQQIPIQLRHLGCQYSYSSQKNYSPAALPLLSYTLVGLGSSFFTRVYLMLCLASISSGSYFCICLFIGRSLSGICSGSVLVLSLICCFNSGSIVSLYTLQQKQIDNLYCFSKDDRLIYLYILAITIQMSTQNKEQLQSSEPKQEKMFPHNNPYVKKSKFYNAYITQSRQQISSNQNIVNQSHNFPQIKVHLHESSQKEQTLAGSEARLEQQHLKQKIQTLQKDLAKFNQMFHGENGNNGTTLEQMSVKTGKLERQLKEALDMKEVMQFKLKKGQQKNAHLMKTIESLQRQVEQKNKNANESRQSRKSFKSERSVTEDRIIRLNDEIELLLSKIGVMDKDYEEALAARDDRAKQLQEQNYYLKEEINKINEISLENQMKLQQEKEQLERKLKQFQGQQFPHGNHRNYEDHQNHDGGRLINYDIANRYMHASREVIIEDSKESARSNFREIELENIYLKTQNQKLSEEADAFNTVMTERTNQLASLREELSNIKDAFQQKVAELEQNAQRLINQERQKTKINQELLYLKEQKRRSEESNAGNTLNENGFESVHQNKEIVQQNGRSSSPKLYYQPNKSDIGRLMEKRLKDLQSYRQRINEMSQTNSINNANKKNRPQTYNNEKSNRTLTLNSSENREIQLLRDEKGLLEKRLKKANKDMGQLKECIDREYMRLQITPHQSISTIERAIDMIKFISEEYSRKSEQIQEFQATSKSLKSHLERLQVIKATLQHQNRVLINTINNNNTNHNHKGHYQQENKQPFSSEESDAQQQKRIPTKEQHKVKNGKYNEERQLLQKMKKQIMDMIDQTRA